ncbi:MAG: hypothetical protein DRQ44_15130, partial [Gammaproteobacteria bacterium]
TDVFRAISLSSKLLAVLNINTFLAKKQLKHNHWQNSLNNLESKSGGSGLVSCLHKVPVLSDSCRPDLSVTG